MSSTAARDALFGGAPSSVSVGIGGARAERLPASMQQARGAAAALEEDNERLASELERKVAALRHATQGIHVEVGEHNRMLGGMGSDFERTGQLMAGALGRLDGLLRGGGTQGHLCYLALFMTGIFVLMWVLMR
jgi:hypothetical protein